MQGVIPHTQVHILVLPINTSILSVPVRISRLVANKPGECGLHSFDVKFGKLSHQASNITGGEWSETGKDNGLDCPSYVTVQGLLAGKGRVYSNSNNNLHSLFQLAETAWANCGATLLYKRSIEMTRNVPSELTLWASKYRAAFVRLLVMAYRQAFALSPRQGRISKD